jgi:hypothetical protein
MTILHCLSLIFRVNSLDSLLSLVAMRAILRHSALCTTNCLLCVKQEKKRQELRKFLNSA